MTYQCADFQACLNDVFVLTIDDYRDELELIQVDRHEDRHSIDERDAFSILLQSKAEQILPQQIYRLQHATMGELDIFLVPIGQDENGVRYEAVFS